MRSIAAAACVCAPLVSLSGCVARPAGAASSGRDLREQAAMAAAVSEARGGKADYRVGAADLLSITVLDNDKLNREVRVAQNGTVSFPLIGVVPVGGLTVIEAERLLADKLKEYVISPQVSVLIKTEGLKKVFVLGQVLKPGACEFPTEGKLTVLGAISMAGGFSPIAAPNRTRVLRKVGGKSETFLIKVSAVTRRGEQEKDILLEPDDIVWVPQAYF